MTKSDNYIIIETLTQRNYAEVNILKEITKNLFKRLYDLKKMGFTFDTCTVDSIEYIALWDFPDGIYLNEETGKLIKIKDFCVCDDYDFNYDEYQEDTLFSTLKELVKYYFNKLFK